MRDLNQNLQIGSKLTDAIEKAGKVVPTSTVETPASGFLVYLRRGLIPAVEPIQYSEVAGQDEFEKLVRAKKAQLGELAVLDGSVDKYKFVHTTVVRAEIKDEPVEVTVSDDESGIPVKQVSSSKTEAPAPASESGDVDIPEGYQTSVMIGPFGASSSSTDVSDSIVAENGHRFRDNSFTLSSYDRYHDGFMFTSNSEVLWEMNLPSTAVVRGQNDAELNGQLSCYPDRIPMGFRQLGWDVLSAAAGSELQQHDDEAAAATLHVAVHLPDDWKAAGAALRESYAAGLTAISPICCDAMEYLIRVYTVFGSGP
ncbi:MAG: hypothetical protein DWI29_02175, partial [Planctomycetota bacterium]